MKETLPIEFKSDRNNYSGSGLMDEIVGMTNTRDEIEKALEIRKRRER